MALKRFRMLALAFLFINLTACLFPSGGPRSQAATSTAPPSATISPTLTPSGTSAPLASASSSPVPTHTRAPTATKSPTPSRSPTITLTPLPVVFNDDFSKEDKSVWADCTICKWQEGRLVMGPYAPGDEVDLPHIATCETCGAHRFYRVAVDAALSAGDEDHSFGLVIALNQNELVMLGIDASQNCIVARYDPNNRNWQILNADPSQVWNAQLKKGNRTNHLEVLVKPSSAKAGTVDYTINLNGSTSFVISGRPTAPSKVGLLVDFHTLEVSFTNFAYEELTP
jgi:hypothetical protein